MNGSKLWWQSKTVWANVLLLLAMLTTALVDVPLVSDSPAALKWIVLLGAVVNVALRFVTDQGIALTRKP